MKAGVSWSDIDGQSFLLFSYVGYWETIVKNNLKRSRFLKNDDIEAMKEIAEFSSIPSFLTNLTINPNGVKNRINIPIINDSAYLNFYVVVKEKNKKNLKFVTPIKKAINFAFYYLFCFYKSKKYFFLKSPPA